MTSPSLLNTKRLVLKVGSALLLDASSLKQDWICALVQDIAALHQKGCQVLLVSSGSIALGREFLSFSGKMTVAQKQAASAMGQIHLTLAWQQAFKEVGIPVAQVLLSLHDTEQRRRHLNVRAALGELLSKGAIPVINENDCVATSEIRFGDNDRLAARVASMIQADTLILLSDIDGLYTSDPKKNPKASFIPEVREMTPEIESYAGPAPVGYSSGGMVTKLEAARIALASGCRMAIVNGRKHSPLKGLQEGARCTWFLPSLTPLKARKRWIASSVQFCGNVAIDPGAKQALLRGSSLLPAGVVALAGDFARGDALRITDEAGQEIGRGLSAYDREDAEQILGKKSVDIAGILGYHGGKELIHRDDLAITDSTFCAKKERKHYGDGKGNRANSNPEDSSG